ncbi:uncharacterized protein MONBRDRAFT_21876 [Monosiga brevicollis MX1]|uniref:Uncharacterized protein n=1 Tax=Monosiga brevicollis TaxID=81824 RepID=A9UNV9_MONBE|nr:uncharacterized protein MONBRDRAFT_21876 [Monosiga brevicollis MX1]EDQ92313.1 predicted protein [Monosiga brevicollis MX1]|eukprot:XP_001742075.1 hypothetical protein [Monosiga brevicollis MX1]
MLIGAGGLVLVSLLLLLLQASLANRPAADGGLDATDLEICRTDTHRIALVITAHVGQQLAAIDAALERWRHFPPCLESSKFVDRDEGPHQQYACGASLIFAVENAAAAQQLQTHVAKHASVQGVLRDAGLEVQIFHAALSPQEDSWPVGPTLAFYRIIPQLRQWDYVLYLEPDARPIRAGWLQEAHRQVCLYESLLGTEGVWVLGSYPRSQAVKGNRPLANRFHLNGNAIYHTGSASFQDFVQRVESNAAADQPFQSQAHGRAYDVDLATFMLQPVHWTYAMSHAHRLVASEWIQNRWREQWSRSEMQARFPQTFVVHGGSETVT